MTKQQRKALLKAGELIASEKEYCICEALSMLTPRIELSSIPEAKLIRPYNVTFWWGGITMGDDYYTSPCRNDRLIGIAMMLTMPKEILEGKCYKKKK